MKAATTACIGFKSPIVTVEAPKPEIGEKDVLVEVYASSVNPKDWKLNQTLSSMIPSFGVLKKPLLIGDDLAGVIVEKGSQVEDFEIGDAVFGMDMNLRTAACAEFARINADCIAKKPSKINFIEAAACPLAGLTALQGLHIGNVSSASKVLIVGASGGVGSFAVQLAKAMGASVTGVCSAKNAEFVKGLGAETIIDYNKVDITKLDDDFDMVFDVTSYNSLDSCSKLLKEGGIFVSTGGNAKAIANSLRDRFLSKNKYAKNVWVHPNKQDLEVLGSYIEKGLVKPIIDSQFPLDQINHAYQRNKTGRCIGKVVVMIKTEQ